MPGKPNTGNMGKLFPTLRDKLSQFLLRPCTQDKIGEVHAPGLF